MERLADENADRAHTRFIVSDDPEEVVEKIGCYVDLGFDHLVFHAPGDGPAPLPRAVLRRRPAQAARAGLAGDRPRARPPPAAKSAADALDQRSAFALASFASPRYSVVHCRPR